MIFNVAIIGRIIGIRTSNIQFQVIHVKVKIGVTYLTFPKLRKGKVSVCLFLPRGISIPLGIHL